MIYGSVCSGMEAVSVAWKPIGWHAAFLSEIEAAPRSVLAHHYPQTPLHGDFTTIQAGQYEAIDVLVGGTPCQSFSIAGLRGGMADERGNLALEYLRLADRLRPRWVLWENVPGVLSSDGGRDFGAFLGGLGKLGYGFAYRVLDAQYFRLAQRRKRVFVVGYLGDWRRAAAVLFEPASLRGHPAPRREAGQRTAPTVARGSPGGRTYGLDADTADSLVPSISPALKARDYKGPSSDGDGDGGCLVPVHIAHSLRGDGFDASEDGTGRGTPLVAVEAYRTSGNSGAYSTGDRVDALNTGTDPSSHLVAFSCKDHGADAGGQVAIAFAQNQRDEVRQMDIAGALVAEPGAKQQTYAAIGHNGGPAMAVRRLTPKECLRLQGFPDDYLDLLHRGKPLADGPKYKMIGNSMATPVIRWIGRRIEIADRMAP